MYSLSNNTAAKDTLNNNDPLVQLVLKEYGIYINNANNVFEKLQRREDSLRRLKDAPTESKITNSGQVTMDAHHPLLNVILPSTLTNPTGPYYPSVQTLLNDLRTVIKDRSIVTLDDDISKLRACHMNMATPQYAINALKQKIIPEVLGQKPVPGLGFEAPGEKYVEIFKVIATFAANAPRDVANGTILVAHKFTSAKKVSKLKVLSFQEISNSYYLGNTISSYSNGSGHTGTSQAFQAIEEANEPEAPIYAEAEKVERAKRPSKTKAQKRHSRRKKAKAKRLSETKSQATTPKTLSSNSFTVTKLTKVEIPKDLERFLSLGVKYVPTLKIKELNFHPTLYDLVRQVSIQILSRSEDHTISKTGIDKLLEKFLDKKRNKLSKEFAKKSRNDQALLLKLNNFLEKNDLIVQNADKNLGPVVIDRKMYAQMVNDHLRSNDWYEIKKPNINLIQQRLADAIELVPKPWSYKSIHFGANASKAVLMSGQKGSKITNPFPNLNPANAETNPANPGTQQIVPYFQGLPKIHKSPISIRPIIPSKTWITTCASIYLHDILSPILNHYQWVLRNSMDCINLLSEYPIVNSNCLLVAADVESLYTNIDIDEGISRVVALLKSKYCPTNFGKEYEVNIIRNLLEVILTENYFQFENTWYHQKKGTAMGTNVAPTYANLFLVSFELEWRKSNSFPELYFRYLDDLFFVIEPGKLDEFSSMITKASPSLKFKFDISKQSAIFLDLFIYKGKRYSRHKLLDHNTYEKPVNKHLYLHTSTWHPHNQKLSWITGENVRHLRNNSNEYAFNKSISQFKQYLIRREYPKDIIEKYLKYNWKDRELFLLRPIPKDEQNIFRVYTPNTPERILLTKYMHSFFVVMKEQLHLDEYKLSIVFTRGQSLFNYTRRQNMKNLATPSSLAIVSASANDPIEQSSEVTGISNQDTSNDRSTIHLDNTKTDPRPVSTDDDDQASKKLKLSTSTGDILQDLDFSYDLGDF